MAKQFGSHPDAIKLYRAFLHSVRKNMPPHQGCLAYINDKTKFTIHKRGNLVYIIISTSRDNVISRDNPDGIFCVMFNKSANKYTNVKSTSV